MSCITKINKRIPEYIAEAMDWLSYPVHVSIDKEGGIHVALSVRIGDFSHYRERHTSEPEDRPVAEFVDELVPHARSVSITFKKNVVDEVRMECRSECLVIHNTKGAPSLDICTLMEVLEIDRSTASRAFNRITRGEQICLTYPRKKWVLSQRG